MVYDPTTMNAEPYYDDFDKSKKFLRSMFRPGYAVQGRELTQLQTVIQNQLAQFGGHVFADGSKVIDSDVSENRLPFFRVYATSITGTTRVTDFEGATFSLTGATSATASTIFQIVHVAEKESDLDPYHVCFYKALNGATGPTYGQVIRNYPANTLAATIGPSGATVSTFGNGVIVSVSDGFRFVDGFFVYHTSQKIAPYSMTASNTVRDFEHPTVRVGFDLGKSFVSHLDDESLNDPAFGSYNYGAPGADRYVIGLTIGFHQLDPSDVSATANFAREDFLEFYRLAGGTTIKAEKYPEYSNIEDTLARRTFDESGNYTVRSFPFRVEESASLSAHELQGIIDPGKAYIFGYEFETQAPSFITIDRARPTNPAASSDESIRAIETLEDVSTTIGNYISCFMVNATNNFGTYSASDLETHPLVYLSSGETQGAFNQIGTARIRDIRWSSGTAFNVYLEEISVTGNTAFSGTTRIFRPGVTSATQAMFYVSDSTLNSPSQDTLIFRVPKGDVIKEVTSTIYGIRKVANATFASGVVVLNKSDFGSDVNHSKADFAGANGVLVSTPGENTIVYTSAGVALTGVAGPTTSATQLRIELSNTSYNGDAYVVGSFDIQDSGSPFDTYTVKTSATASASIPYGLQTDANTGKKFAYLNGQIDVYEILSISGSTGGSNIELSSFFDLDTGQTDNLYDWSRIVLKNEYRNEGVTGTFTVLYRYFTRASGRGPFYVNSYSGLTFADIPSYTSTRTGEVFDLCNAIDFRPDRAGYGAGATAGSNKNLYNYTERYLPHPLKSYDINFKYYLPRTDKIVLTRDKNFDVIKGTYDDFAPVPPDRDDAMTLYTVRVNPYTYDAKDLNIRYVENKRYTMRDIGKLEKRLQTVEYYTTLSLLEQEANSLAILDSNGENRFKNGILVDSFKGHSVGDVLNQWYACSMDFSKGELRPPFTMRSYGFQVESSLPSGLTQSNGRLVTLNYTTEPAISQPVASKSISVNPFNVVSWLGTLSVNPSSDTWFDTENAPDVVANIEGENDAWLAVADRSVTAAFGTQWNAWENIWAGESVLDEAAESRSRFRDAPNRRRWDNNRFTDSQISRDTLLVRSGQVRSGIQESGVPNTINRVVGSRIVNVGIVPFMRAQTLTIDAAGMKPNTRVYPFFDDTAVSSYVYPSGGTFGSAIYTDAAGAVSDLSFVVPAGLFRTGDRLFRLTDEASNTVANAKTAAEVVYRSSGVLLTQENTVVATRVPTARREDVDVDGIVTDPVRRARQRSDNSGTWFDPIAQTILVDPTIYPNGLFVDSVDLYFAAKDEALPVTVQIRPTVNGYPHSSMVVPQAEKTLNASAVNTSEDASTETNFRFDSPIYLTPGEYAIVVISNSDAYEVYVSELGQNRLGTSERISQQPYMGSLFKSQNSSTWSPSQLEDLTFVVNRCVFDTAASESNRRGSFVNRSTAEYNLTSNDLIHEVRVSADTVEPTGSYFDYELDVKESAEIGTAFPTGNQFRFIPNLNYQLATERAIKAEWSSADDAAIQVKATFNSDSDKISPVLDLDRLSVITVRNLINDSSELTGANDNGELFADPSGVTSANHALARYISKQVTLEDGFESNDLNVYVTVAKPAGTSIQLFAKYNTAESTVPFDSRPYTQLSLKSGSTDYISANKNDFAELVYNFGATGLTDTFKTFALKIVMYSNNPVDVPIFKDIRAIALPSPV